MCLFCANRSILLNNYSTTIGVRKLSLLDYYHPVLRPHLSFSTYLRTVIYKKTIQFSITCVVILSLFRNLMCLAWFCLGYIEAT